MASLVDRLRERNIVEDKVGVLIMRLDYIEFVANKRLNVLSTEITAMAAQTYRNATRPYPIACSDCNAPIGTPCMQGCPNLD